MSEKFSYRDYLKSAADAALAQVAEDHALGIPVDPDVADFMGAHYEDQSALDNLLDVPGASAPGPIVLDEFHLQFSTDLALLTDDYRRYGVLPGDGEESGDGE